MTVLAEPLTRLLRRAGAGLLGGPRRRRRRARSVRDPADAARPDRRRRSASTSPAARSRSSPTSSSAWSPATTPGSRTARSPSTTCGRCRTRSRSSRAAGDRRRPLEVELERQGVDRPHRAGAGDQPADAAVRGQRHRHVRVRAGPAGPALPRHARPGHRRRPRSTPCRSPRPRTGTRAARPTRRWSGCAGCCTTSPCRSRTTLDRRRRPTRLAVKPQQRTATAITSAGTTAEASPPRPTSGETTAPRANWEKPRTALPVPATSRTSAIARAAELPMMPPLRGDRDEDRRRVGPGRRAEQRPARRRPGGARPATAIAAAPACGGSTRSTSRLATQPAAISPTALTPKATP